MFDPQRYEQQEVVVDVGVIRVTPSANGRYYFSWDFVEGGLLAKVNAGVVIEWCFTSTNCLIIVGQIPDENMPARVFASSLGFTNSPDPDRDGWTLTRLTIGEWCRLHRRNAKMVRNGKP